MRIIALFFLSLGIVACAFRAPLALPTAPGTGVIGVTKLPPGFVVTAAKRDHLVGLGVPSAWLEPRGVDYWISQEHEGYAADSLLKERNP